MFWLKLKSVKPATWARTACLVLALVNQVLAIFGKNALPFAENDVYQIVSMIATIVTGVIAWWKNNSFTEPAQLADDYLAKLREEIKSEVEADKEFKEESEDEK